MSKSIFVGVSKRIIMAGFRCNPCGNEFQNTQALLLHKKLEKHWQYFGQPFNLPEDYKSGIQLVDKFLTDLISVLRKHLNNLSTSKFEGLIEICNEILYFTCSEGFEQLEFIRMDLEEVVNNIKRKKIDWTSMKDKNRIKTEILELIVEINLISDELSEN